MTTALLDRLRGERAMGAWDRVAITLGALADATAASDPRAAIEYLREMAAIRLDRLGDPDGAVDGYRRLLELDSSDSRALVAVQPILRMTHDWALWTTVQQMLIDLEADPTAKAALLRELVCVCRDELADEHGVEEAEQKLRDMGL